MFPSREKPYRYAFYVLPSRGPRLPRLFVIRLVKEKHSNSGSNDVALCISIGVTRIPGDRYTANTSCEWLFALKECLLSLLYNFSFAG